MAGAVGLGAIIGRGAGACRGENFGMDEASLFNSIMIHWIWMTRQPTNWPPNRLKHVFNVSPTRKQKTAVGGLNVLGHFPDTPWDCPFCSGVVFWGVQ